MINAHYLELPLPQTCFHGSKVVPAIEVLLYKLWVLSEPSTKISQNKNKPHSAATSCVHAIMLVKLS